MKIEIRRVDWPYASVFRIAYAQRTHARTVVVELQDDGLVGRGEALGVSYHGETPEVMLAQLEAARADVERGIDRACLQKLLPPGGARNALDCAFWDLEAKRSDTRAWELAGVAHVAPILTDFTIGIADPQVMADTAVRLEGFDRLKLKLGAEGDLERVEAVRAVRPTVELVVDANQGWDEERLVRYAPRLAELGVLLIEQPLPVGRDEMLRGFDSPVPLGADESCQTSGCLPDLIGKYQVVNIKLDKCGGLTEALRLAERARESGFRLMVGCMAGSSLSMAPAFVVGQLCEFVDLDGPLLSTSDVPNGIRYEGGLMHPPARELWG